MTTYTARRAFPGYKNNGNIVVVGTAVGENSVTMAILTEPMGPLTLFRNFLTSLGAGKIGTIIVLTPETACDLAFDILDKIGKPVR